MTIKRTTYLAACLLLACLTANTVNAKIEDSSMLEGGLITPPWGFIDFCKRHTGECSTSVNKAEKVTLTPRRIAELVVVQLTVNRKFSYATDINNYAKREYWAYPRFSGDCEDYAIEKRRRLIAAGWPRSTLLLTAARMTTGRKHLVLVVVTDKGDFVLDNNSSKIRLWNSLNYKWLARQSRFKEAQWVSLKSIKKVSVPNNGSIAAP